MERRAGGYFERLQAARPAVNVLSLVPNGQLRLVDRRPRRPPGRARPSSAEMKKLLAESLAEGAWGYSTGLEYAQEAGATEDEVAELCRVLARGGGLYATHTRRRDEGATDSVAEAIRVATASRGAAPGLAPRSEERDRGVAPLGRARRGGPGARARRRVRHAHAALRPHAPLRRAAAVGARRGARAASPSSCATRRPATGCGRTGASSAPGDDWGRIVLLDNPFWPQYARRDLASIAAERGQAPLDTVYDLLLGALDAPHRLMVIIHAYTEEEQREAFAHPLCVPGSDATTLAPDGPLADTWFHGAYTWAVVVLPLHGPRRGPAQPRGGRAQAQRAACRPARPLRPRRCSGRARGPTSRSSIPSASPSAARPSSRTSSPRACATSSSTACTRCATAS